MQAVIVHVCLMAMQACKHAHAIENYTYSKYAISTQPASM